MERPRAVIYNRCSTEEERQKDALAKQVQESRDCVREQGWELVDTYVEARSGTTVKGRSEYNRLYQDLEENRFDIIVIKSQDRLMRNTKDWYLFLDRMQKNGKKLYMYLEGKFYTPEDALVTGIKAILAEEYSRELSKKINNAHKNRQKEGKHFVFTNQMYGLKKLPDGKIVIHGSEAEIVRMIFRLSVDGYGTHTSAEILYQNGYTNRNGKMISPSVVRNIIRNPVYMGTVVQNKRHYEFESKRTVKNPESEWIVHEGVVPAIVDEHLFEMANRALDGRKRKRAGKYENQENNGQYGCFGNVRRHALSGKIICGLCGEPFYRTVRQKKQGKAMEWKCSNYLHHGRRAEGLRRDRVRKADRSGDKGCDNIHIDEKKLFLCLEQECGQRMRKPEQQDILDETLLFQHKDFREDYKEEKQKMLDENLRQTEYKQNILLEKLLDGVIDDQLYQRKNQELQEKMKRIKGQLVCLERDFDAENKKLKECMEDFREHSAQEAAWQAQMAAIMSDIIKIKVYPECMEIYLRAGALPEKGEEMAGSAKYPYTDDGADKPAVLTVFQNCSTSYYPMIEAQKKHILELMQGNPGITAKEAAEEMGITLSMVYRRIRQLKAEGKIYYSRTTGRREWTVVKTALDFSD